MCPFLKKTKKKPNNLIGDLTSVCCLKERDVFIHAAFHHSREKSDFRAFCHKVRWVFHLADWGLCPVWLTADLLFPHCVSSLFSVAGCRRLLKTWRPAEYLNRLVHGNVRIKGLRSRAVKGTFMSALSYYCRTVNILRRAYMMEYLVLAFYRCDSWTPRQSAQQQREVLIRCLITGL